MTERGLGSTDTPMAAESSRKQWVPPKGGALHNKPRRDAAAELRRQVFECADEVFTRYVEGESYQAIAATLPFPIPGWKLRVILMDSEETREEFSKAAVCRAHALVEQAIDHGRMAAAIGDSSGLRTAIDVNLKVASKLNSVDYGDTKKVELTGQGGGPIKMVALTDEQLMEIAAKGAKGAEE